MSDEMRGAPAGALDRGLAILSHLARHRKSTVAELAESLQLSRSTTYRLVERLRQQGWLMGEEHGGPVRLGPSAAQLAVAATESNPLRDVAVPILRELLESTRETVSLAVPSALKMVFIHRERGPQPVGVSAELGDARPLHCTSVGRAYLAALPVEHCERVLEELVASSDSPVRAGDLPALREILETTRARGWSQDRREFDRSSSCCGAAIRDQSGMPVAAISVAGVAERMEPEIEAIGRQVASTGRRISAFLGYVV
ncbi:IclR family transcriptional regulator [Pseudonocardia nematodicida]|uniref:IclR family transcriptional regulator n=1 Tax=Pseudonocardia nematodicida TaxID=1206997 RepID=A0ABV1KGB7_9PSEU